MRIEKKNGSEKPKEISYILKLGLRMYTIAFDIKEVETATENGEEASRTQFEWSEVTFGLGIPTFSQLVSAMVQCRYPHDDMEAIINNKLLGDGDEEHEAEYEAMQAWRKEAKTKAKELLLSINGD